ncbi:MAG: flagellar motor protein PomA [Gammaproteobacteria bacterium]|nr:MAG: flagellar motor protein PomA [Gammaproteobacteria bacterium]
MDLASLIGLIGAVGIVLAAIITGGSAGIFVNIPSVLVVLGGTAFAVMAKYTLGQFLGVFKAAMRAIKFSSDDPVELIKQIVELANLARKEGLLALEGFESENKFMQKGIQLVADGHEPEFVQKVLGQDIDQQVAQNKTASSILMDFGDVAPAMGMIGTLIGLVQMLSNMDDPKKIGPAMAVALLTTLYGAFIANVLAIPVANKLDLRNTEEKMIRTLILQGLIAIQEGLNPRVIEELLKTYLSEKAKAEFTEE